MEQGDVPAKPIKRWHIFAYDYHECAAYLQARDGYDERDYAGKFSDAGENEHVPYQDFWHFVCARAPIVSNGSVFLMGDWWHDDAEPWQQEILAKYLDTFGDIAPDGSRSIEFYVSW